MKNRGLFCFLVFVFLMMTPALARCGRNKPEPIPLKGLIKLEIPDSLKKDSDAVVLLDEVEMELKGDRVYIKSRIVKKILKAKRHSKVVFDFTENSFNKISSIEARAIYPDGKEEKIKKKNIVELPSFSEYELYSDQKTRCFSFYDVKPGTVIEVVVSKVVKNLLFIDEVPFRGFSPVLRKRFSFVHPVDANVEIYAKNISAEPDEVIQIDKNRRMLFWERFNIKPIEIEEMMPPLSEYIPTISPVVKSGLKYGEKLNLNSWGDICGWYARLSEKSLEVTPEMRAKAEEICRGAGSPLAVAELLYDWVRRNIRYLRINLGLHGYMPHSAGECLENRYGDCKDKAALLTAMLRAMDVDAFPVIVRTSDLGLLKDPGIEPGYFNHVIAGALIEGDTIFMDPTCPDCPFRVLPAGDQGAHALPVMEGVEGLATLPEEQYEANSMDVSIDMEIGESGDASIVCRLSFSGFFRAKVARAFRERHGRTMKDIAYALFIDESFGLDLGDVKLESPELDSGEDGGIKLEYKVPSLLDTNKQVVFVDAVAFPLSFTAPESDGRRYPLFLGLRRSYVYEASIAVPPGWKVIELPESHEIGNRYFTYVLSFENGENRLRIRRRWEIAAREVPVSDYQEVRKDIMEMHRCERLKVPIGKIGM